MHSWYPTLSYIPESHDPKRLLLDCMFKPEEGVAISTILPTAEGINPTWLSSSCSVWITWKKMGRVQGTWSTPSLLAESRAGSSCCRIRVFGYQLDISQPAFFFNSECPKNTLSSFSAVQQYVSEPRNHCIILFKSLISCKLCFQSSGFGDKKHCPFELNTILLAWIVINGDKPSDRRQGPLTKKRDAITQEEIRENRLKQKDEAGEGLHFVVSDSSSCKMEINAGPDMSKW